MFLVLDGSCSWPRKGLPSKSRSLTLASHVVSSTPSLLSTMSTKALERMGPTCQIDSKKAILVFEPTLYFVIRIWCFYEWFFNSFITGKAMINSVYVRKPITIVRWKSIQDFRSWHNWSKTTSHTLPSFLQNNILYLRNLPAHFNSYSTCAAKWQQGLEK